jgi:acyl-CoA reductase-like NAD-dependent aldehyde dehydrogenase
MQQGKLLIDGNWIDGDSPIISINPATEEPIGRVGSANEGIIEDAVNAAIKAHNKWDELSLWERAKYLKNMAQIILENADSIKELITKEMGRPIVESEIEVNETVDMINFFAEEGKAYLDGRTLPINSSLFPDKFSFIERDSVGVIAIIKPWNYPLELPIWAIAPALLAGNTIVFKPSEYTSLVGLEIGKIAKQAKLPDGVLNIIFGDREIGENLVKSDVDMISFTGSIETGKNIMRNSSEKLHKLSLELGGSDPLIVYPSADLEEAINGAVWGRYTNCGQVCVSAKRIILFEEIADEFLIKFKQKTSKLKIGNGLNRDVDIGPLVSDKQRKKLMDMVKEATDKGAKLLLGGKIPLNQKKGYFFEPTILSDVNEKMRVMNEETFGPVASIIIVKNEEQAINISNSNRFGLGASIWTTDLDTVFRARKKIKSGMIWVNDINVAYPNCPWGGIKNSGIGKDLGKEGILEYTLTKHINIDYGKKISRDWW